MPLQVKDGKIVVPFKIIRDHRERRAGWTFSSVALMVRGKRHTAHPAVHTQHMKTADYTIHHHEDSFLIERKSISDLVGTLTRGRRRFVSELRRMDGLDFSAVVVEGSHEDMIAYTHQRSEATPQAVHASYLALSMRFGTKWYWLADAQAAERVALQLMLRWYSDIEE